MTLKEILADPGIFYCLKDAIKTAYERDWALTSILRNHESYLCGGECRAGYELQVRVPL